MIVCSVQKVSKMYGGNEVFRNLSFQIDENERLGLVGRNGSGKTTLFKLLSGIELPDSGQVHWKKGLKIGYLAQIPTYEDDMTVLSVLRTAFSSLIEMDEKMKMLELEMSETNDEVQLEQLVLRYGDIQEKYGLQGGYEIEASVERIANGLRISNLLQQKFSELSGGEKTKVGLGLILLQEPELLLLDEPTNHLDLFAVEWLSGFLREYKGTVVVISHDRYFLDEVLTKVIDLEDGEITIYKGNYTKFVKEKEERLLREFQAYQEQQKKIKKMKEAIKRLREWANQANPPNEGLHKRARNMERALERMEKLNRPVLNRKKMNVEFEAGLRSGNEVIEIKGVTKAFSSSIIFEGVDMHVQFQDRVAIVGENGTGKSTLLKMIMNQEHPDSGSVQIGSSVKVGYLSQQIINKDSNETVLDAFRNTITVTEGEARNILARFLFLGHAVFRKVNQLSGGEHVRLRLAQLMYQNINLLILDEPTNHLDIESREVLEEALEEYNGTILAVSHDRYFLNRLFTKTYWIEDGKMHGFSGGYQWALQKMGEKRSRIIESNDIPEKKVINHVVREENNEQQISYYEKQIEEIELEIVRITKLMEEEDNLNDLQDLYQEKDSLERKCEKYYEQLEEYL
ncbi:ribosomal protection-like ABC-F family protein [Bacillus solimangrovi]|uniref:ABC transporter ATP-binding protein n=1 Tax=Bacillus solimangrovi TaxID=1305675 RepID=A0A1E5LH33_9BACI|nr:ABC-F type ribosomal protection protein [Bacillus solimangrovi]OEH93356.1 ABC transporter ATP-binding protein [Bacillus solimangrovi]